MFNMENIGREQDGKNIIQNLMDAVQIMTRCENDVNNVIEKIIKSCNTQGTKGADHKSLLLTKVECLKRLAGLYRSVSEKYKKSALKLTSGISEDKVMAELGPYNISINDQLKSEKECYGQVLSILSA